MNNVIARSDGESVCDDAVWNAKSLEPPLGFFQVLVRQEDAKVDASGPTFCPRQP